MLINENFDEELRREPLLRRRRLRDVKQGRDGLLVVTDAADAVMVKIELAE